LADDHRAAAVGFHAGELAVQRQAGVQSAAARLAPMVAGGELRGGASAFFAKATFAALSARDGAGRLWVSPLFGDPGFLHVASPTRLLVAATPPATDPLRGLLPAQPVGLVVMDFPTRRRLRINGMLSAADSDELVIEVDQAYGNCPQYIQPRQVRGPSADTRLNVFRGNELRPQDVDLVRAADTFFLGTTHPESGNDASHRGGPPGFVGVDSGRLLWPDYPGNNMFNSFGNLFADPTAALLFVDFRSGATLQLSGTAAVRWDADASVTGRCVVFAPQQVVAIGPPA
jgi:predicted pyridoxine 5'-phosphate oxidase superfamily flavin-nucleotide-binding protein